MASISLCLNMFMFLVMIRDVKPRSENENSHNGEHWIIHTNLGPVEATVKVVYGNQEAFVFYGIPYAEPPIGQLRFQAPQPIKPWTEVLRTNSKPDPCYQTYDLEHLNNKYLFNKVLKRPWTEDCLKLNVWVPKPKIIDVPVVVVFHPGFFLHGSNHYPDGTILAAYAQDVVVSMNYRLGAFGFLNLGVPEAPGNVGLLDQQLALKWINENIHHFGGKAEAVILLGAGNAGSASVGYHMLSQGSSKYFKTVASYSGAVTCSWAFQEREASHNNAKKLSEILGCLKTGNAEQLTCLRDAHPEDIVKASLSKTLISSLHFLPTVDGAFMTESPKQALKSGHFKNTSLLSASDINEASLLFWEINNDIMPNPEKGLNIEQFRKSVKRIYPSLNSAGLELVEEYYVSNCNRTNTAEIRDAGVRVYNDLLFNCCINEMDELVSEKGGSVYRCVDNLTKASNPSWMDGVHALSVDYLFGYPLIDPGYSQAEKYLTTYSLDWVKDRTRKKFSVLEEDLVLFNTREKPYKYFDMAGLSTRFRYRERHCNLWNEIIPNLENTKNNCIY